MHTYICNKQSKNYVVKLIQHTQFLSSWIKESSPSNRSPKDCHPPCRGNGPHMLCVCGYGGVWVECMEQGWAQQHMQGCVLANGTPMNCAGITYSMLLYIYIFNTLRIVTLDYYHLAQFVMSNTSSRSCITWWTAAHEPMYLVGLLHAWAVHFHIQCQLSQFEVEFFMLKQVYY